ncbi:MAG: metal-sulfur cluster assembly factor [Candidatus Magasanikbacteria bacterium]|nr:metal-sulfur cluster assembly factor [Candidatus Magasanikbacteria bacterium]
MHTTESVREALKQIKDPELNCDIVSLGLVYAIRLPDAKHVEIDVTFTSMGCPAGPYILSEVQRVIDELEGSPEGTVHLVWEPAWTKDRVDPLVREELMEGI